MHDDFRIGVEREMIVASGQQAIAQVSVVGQLSVESEGEPFPKPPMMSLEWLGVAGVVLAASRVARVPERPR